VMSRLAAALLSSHGRTGAGCDRDHALEAGLLMRTVHCRRLQAHPETIQIAVHQSVEKIPDHSLANRRVGPFRKALSQKDRGFAPFLSARFWKIPRPILRFYYGRQRPKKSSPN
jgi:hypothetical protein